MREASRLTGDEPLLGLDGPDATVLDFWRWAFSDLCANNVRGVFAEWLVARLLGLELPVRASWDSWDLETPEGVRIEVKASAYVQSWHQERPSTLRFSGLRATAWDAATNTFGEGRTYNAHLYVFCLQIEQDAGCWDALDLSQWRFHLLPREALEALGQQSLGLATLRGLSRELTAEELQREVRAAVGRVGETGEH